MKKINFIVLSIILFVGIFSSTQNVLAATLLSDDFTGTTISTAKWNETDAGGVGGTTGNIQQNGSLSVTGSAAWGANYVVTDTTYDRSLGSLEVEADITCTANGIPGIGYGDPGVLTGGGQSYTLYILSRVVWFSRQQVNVNSENINTGFTCTAGTPFHIRIVIGDTTGAVLYINGSGTAAATLTGGTFNNKGFFLTGHSGTASLIDNFLISGPDASTEPSQPTDLVGVPASTQIALSWTAPNNGGSAITDYVVEYKLSSEPTTWSIFTDGISTSTTAIVTGLTNGLSYDFRVSATNLIGTSTVSATASAIPALSAPTAPRSLTATSGNGQAELTWMTPLSNGGASITDYVVEYKLSTEPTTWTTFSDGVSASTEATVTGLTNSSSYDFRISATNSVGTGAVSGTASTTPESVTMSDSFTSTTIDTNNWVETDAGGLGGTAGNVQQNGSLNITTGVHTWATQDGIKTVETYDRSNGDVSMEFSVTRTSCGTGVAVAAGYGDFNFTTVASASYIFLANSTAWEIYYWLDGANVAGNSPQILSGITSCTNGVPTTFKIVALEAGGAKVYVNGSGTASATLTGGTFTNKTFWIGSGTTAGGTSTYDDVQIIEPATGPFAPTGLTGTAEDSQVSLSWTSGGDNGSTITDYTVQYKLNSAGSWSTFSDSISTLTTTTVTGLTNGSLYNFKVLAVNANGTSSPSGTTNTTPISSTPTAPTANSVSISGSASLGELLTGTYNYNDVNGNTEGISTFRWLRADSPSGIYSVISGATSINYTVTSDDLTKYLKFEVTPVANISPTSGASVLSSATTQVSEIDYINQILSTGQSLSVGVASTPALTTTQPYSNLMLSGGNGGIGAGGSFIPLVEGGVETISSSMANTITANDTGNDFDVAVSLHGVSGYVYSQLKKGTGPYNTGMSQVTNAKSAAISLGRTSRIIGVTTIHGETDNYNGVSGATYQSYLEEWQNDYDTDVKAITGQSNEVIMFLDQMSSFMSSYANDATSEIPIYQLYAAEENPNEIVLVAPKYFFNYSDRHHLTGASSRWLGEYYGKVIKKVVINHESWRPLSPDSAIRSGNIIDVNFHVPAGILAFDTTLVSARTNKGFEYYDSTSSATITNVEILDSDTVRVTLSGVPSGANQRIRYAYTGVPGTNTGSQNAGSAAGNLRDTDPYPSLYGNTLYNWAVHFDEAVIIDSTAPTITNVSSSKVNGTYGEGEVIDIDVFFSEEVTSSGNVTVTLETGTVDRICTFTVTNSNTGTCNYTVQGGDVSSDLTVSSISGTIVDQASNAMTSFNIGTNLAANKVLIIDTEGSVISLLISTPNNTTSTITWTTDEVSSSIVEYGLTSSYGTSTVEEDTSPRVTNHSVDIGSLLACTRYHFRVISTDGASNTTTGSDNTFTTTGCTGGAPINEIASDTVATSTGAVINLNSGTANLSLDIPDGFDVDGANDVVFQLNQLTTNTLITSVGSPSGKTVVGSHTYDLLALSGFNTALSIFDEPLTLTVSYTNNEVVGLDETTLVIYYWTGTAWESLSDCVVNTLANTVSCSTTHFTTFGVFGSAAAATPAVNPVVGGGGIPVGWTNLPIAPIGGFKISVSSGGGTTNTRVVNLKFNAGSDVKKMVISLAGDFSDATQENYSPVKQIDLCSKFGGAVKNPTCLDGQYTVYVKFYTQYGQASNVVFTKINLVTTSFEKDLRFGSADSQVKILQQFLNNNGYKITEQGPGSPGNETNLFGSLTRQALIKFQIANNITPPSGYFGPKTRQFINSSGSMKPVTTPIQQSQDILSTIFTTSLSKGMQSEDVRQLQKLLASNSEIYPEGKITGYFGTLTEKAVQIFQLKYGVLNSRTDIGFGVVGPKTRAKLQEVLGN